MLLPSSCGCVGLFDSTLIANPRRQVFSWWGSYKVPHMYKRFLHMFCAWFGRYTKPFHKRFYKIIKFRKVIRCILSPSHMQRFTYVSIYLHICKFTHVCKSVHWNGFAHVCKIFSICKNFIFAPSEGQVQSFVCIFANFTRMRILSCEHKVKVCIHT